MKKILTVYTGGTICCASDGKMRNLSPELAKRALLSNFAQSNSRYSKLSHDLFEDSEFDKEKQTLSENMTLEKLSDIIKHIKSFSTDKYMGIIVMHGTDTLAFTASLFSFVFSYLNIPLMLVSGNRPPSNEKSNANENFKIAVELIMMGISPNIYVPYKNSDGKMWLHLGTNIMQCGDFSEDFYGASEQKSMVIRKGTYKNTLKKCAVFNKKSISADNKELSNSVLYIKPYTGLNYSKIDLKGIKAVVHGTYHSGTVCVEANSKNSINSILYLSKECEKLKIPLFIAPTKLSSDQYSSVYHLKNNSTAEFLNMTAEAAYTKALIGIMRGFEEEKLISFMQTEINCEMIN